jgi:catechol 2,3-dioxygenase-like lactoylglutathione lyase family enzyme
MKRGGAPDDQNVLETGSDDHIALSVEDSSGAVQFMKDNGLAYWDRLLADRGLYQVFVRDPNGVVVELNDYNPDLGAIDPMSVQGRD